MLESFFTALIDFRKFLAITNFFFPPEFYLGIFGNYFYYLLLYISVCLVDLCHLKFLKAGFTLFSFLMNLSSQEVLYIFNLSVVNLDKKYSILLRTGA